MTLEEMAADHGLPHFIRQAHAIALSVLAWRGCRGLQACCAWQVEAGV